MTTSPAGRTRTTTIASGTAGVVVGLAVLAMVAQLVLATAFMALVSFTGCLFDCTDPDPVAGAAWLGLGIGLLVLPVAAGRLAARLARGREATPARVGGVLVLLVLAVVVAWRLGPYA